MIKKLAVLLLLVVSPTFVVADETFYFSSIRGLADQEIGTLIMEQVYEEAGLRLHVIPMPGEKAQHAANSGEVDGEVMRIFAYGPQTQNVIRVQTPFYTVKTVGYILEGQNIIVNNKHDLANYRLAAVRGVKHTDEITAGITPLKLDRFLDPEKMMKFLANGKTDIALTDPREGDLMLKGLGYKNITRLPIILAEQNLYHYIHKKNKHLVEKIDSTLKRLIETGKLERIIRKAEKQVLKNRKR